ncbi:MAG: KAP family P-loop NTPase fold protein [Janthinobacterium lividum]
MWADTESEVDFLNYSEVAEMAAEMIGNPSLLPLSLGIFGTWGTGKSSILKLVHTELVGGPEENKYLILDFDAWLYQDFDDAKAALMAVIAKALYDAAPTTLKEKAASLYRRVNKLKILGLAAEAGMAAHGVPAFGVISRGLGAVEDLFTGGTNAEDGKAIKDGVEEAKKKTEGLIAKEEKRGAPEEIAAFRAEFSDVLLGLNKTLVVFIDNLDRCNPANAIHTLEAIRLFLFLPKTAFVIAADEDMIRHSVSQHFKNPSDRHVADYLDKLIQMPIRVPRVGVQEVRAYMFSLFAAAADLGDDRNRKMGALRDFLLDRLRNSWRRDADFTVAQVAGMLKAKDNDRLIASLDVADRIAPLLAYSANVKGNPRIIKRMLNVIRMRSSVARKRGIPLDEAVIAKLALFERCTDVSAIEAMHNAINLAEEGSPEFFAKLEHAQSDETEVPLPDPWKNHLAFVRDWARLEPKLAGLDLKPAVYLSRETVALRLTSASLSPAAVKALNALCETSTVQSQAARAAIATVDGGEHSALMDALIGEMRRKTDWSRPRSDFRGALVLAEVSAPTGEALGRFVRTLEMQRPPRWMTTLMAGKPWA